MPIQYSFQRTGANLSAPMEFQRTPTSNEYVADVSSDRTADSGDYELIVTATSGWSSSGGATSCVVRRKIAVVEALNLQMIVVGTIVGTLLVALLLLAIYVMRSHRAATKRILVSFMKHEGVLGVKLAWEFWVREP